MSNPTNVTTILRRQRGLTEEAAAAAVDQACRRLRLPTMSIHSQGAGTQSRISLISRGGLVGRSMTKCCPSAVTS